VIALWSIKEAESVVVKYWELVADILSKAGWSWGWSLPWIPKDERSGLLTLTG
jgi:hypothetical protein